MKGYGRALPRPGLPKLLDLFCGAGGVSMGYYLAGLDVYGVDIRRQNAYPFPFRRADALDLLADPEQLNAYHVVHASPPCQRFTAYQRAHRGRLAHTHPDHIDTVRQALQAWGGLYVIENVPGAPLRDPITLCGSSFGLDVRRHRLFESNVELDPPPCQHHRQLPRFAGATNRAGLRRTVEVGAGRVPLEVQQRAMGIDWMGTAELTQAIPPAYTRWLGQQLLAAETDRPLKTGSSEVP